MKKTKIVLEIGIVLAVLAVFTASAAADNILFLEPSDISCGPGEEVTDVWVYLNATQGVTGFQIHLKYEDDIVDIVNITSAVEGTNPNWLFWDPYWKVAADGHHYLFVTGSLLTSEVTGDKKEFAKITLKCLNPGTRPLEFLTIEETGPAGDPTEFVNLSAGNPPFTDRDGTFTCTGETYTISGYTDPAANEVNITNLNKSTVVKHRPADYIGPDGFYNLTLNVPTEVEVGNVLQIFACDVFTDNESTCNTTTHTVVNAPGEDTNVNLTLNHYCLNWLTYPYSIWDDPNWSGPAVMQMLINHYRPEEPSQADLNATGIAHNQACNSDLLQVDPLGMQWTLNDILHNTSSYGGGKRANYGIGSYDNVISTLHYICYWQHAGPGAAPTYGNYSNWMSIRGIHTSADPYPGPYPPGGDYEIYGFWINDPNPTGIGENSYKCVDQWTSEYYFNLTGVDDPVNDTYYNKYVAVCEPPEQPDVEITIVHSAARLDGPVKPELMGLDVVKAAIDGVNEELVPYDHAFAEVFAKTIAGRPLLVTDESGDYYLVPFNMPIEKRPIPFRKPVEIENVDGGMVKLISVVDGKAVIKPVPIELIRIKEKRTLVVVIVDAEDGSFKEASWVADPVKYLPVSKREALKFVFKEIRQSRLRPFGRPVIELVHRAASPYSPDWKITIGQMVFYVSQDGTVSYDKPLPTPTRPPRPIKPGPIRIPPI